MNYENYNFKDELEYHQYNDYVFKSTLQRLANGVLKFLKIPYEINNMILTEIANTGPTLHRLDFAGEALNNDGETICIILECQSKLPSDEDVKRFFQYVTSINSLKNLKVELYILCIDPAPYKTRKYVLNNDCVYTMHVISLKDINGRETLNKIKDKINNNEKITDEYIATLQLIVYTDYDETPLEIITEASIVKILKIDSNKKEAILYILDVLSSNMLDKKDKDKLMEETKMLNPRYEYLKNQGIKEGKEEGIKKGKEEGIKEGKKEGIKKGKEEGKLEVAKNLLNENFPLEKIIKITGLPKSKIINLK